MVPITIDISGVVNRLVLSKEEMHEYGKYLLGGIVTYYMQSLEKNVKENLHSTRTTYLRALSHYYEDDLTAVISLDGKGVSKLAIAIEEGASAFDIKRGFEKSNKRVVKLGEYDKKLKRYKEGGWYLTIPFRVATSRAIGESTIFSGKLPQKVQKVLKNEGFTNESNLPDEFKTKNIRPEIVSGGRTIPAYEHKTFFHAGIKRVETDNGRGEYVKFRRVSDKTMQNDPESWIHKGFVPHKFMDKARLELEGNLDNIVNLAEKQFFENR